MVQKNIRTPGAFPSPARAVVRFSNEQSEFGLFSLGRQPGCMVLLSHRLRGEGGGASHQRGAAFPSGEAWF